MDKEKFRLLIIEAAQESAKDFLKYKRWDGAELKETDIQMCVEEGFITKEEIVEAFKKQLEEWW